MNHAQGDATEPLIVNAWSENKARTPWPNMNPFHLSLELDDQYSTLLWQLEALT